MLEQVFRVINVQKLYLISIKSMVCFMRGFSKLNSHQYSNNILFLGLILSMVKIISTNSIHSITKEMFKKTSQQKLENVKR